MTSDHQIRMHKYCLRCDISKKEEANSYQNKVRLAMLFAVCVVVGPRPRVRPRRGNLAIVVVLVLVVLVVVATLGLSS